MTIEKPAQQESSRDTAGRFKPGFSGNPAGSPPKNVSITALLKDRATQIDPETGKTYAQLVADKIYDMAVGKFPNLTAAQEILNRIDGKVTERHEISGLMIHATPEMLAEAQARLKVSTVKTDQLLTDYQDKKLLGQGKESIERENL